MRKGDLRTEVYHRRTINYPRVIAGISSFFSLIQAVCYNRNYERIGTG